MHIHDVHDMSACVSCLGQWACCLCSIRVLWICYFLPAHEGHCKRCSWTKRRSVAFVLSQYPQKPKQPREYSRSYTTNQKTSSLLSGRINLRTRDLGVLGTPLLSQPRFHASSFVAPSLFRVLPYFCCKPGPVSLPLETGSHLAHLESSNYFLGQI